MNTALLLVSSLLAGTELGTDGTRFTLNGKPTFLLGMSYYGGLGAPEEAIRADLDDLAKGGFNWIRVWATWAAFKNDVSAVDMATGGPREPFLGKLRWLLGECDRRGLVVDVTLSRGNGGTGPARLKTMDAHRRAVETLLVSLKDLRNWYLDLSNERNIEDSRFTSVADLRELKDLSARLDPRRLVTASHTGDPSREEVSRYLLEARLDFLSVHRPRRAGSPAETGARTRGWIEVMRELGRMVPVHHDEPFRRGFGGWEPRAEDFLQDARAALAGGAAGWCFHNGAPKGDPEGRPRRSFDLRERRLFESLDAEERRAVEGLRKALAEAAAGGRSSRP